MNDTDKIEEKNSKRFKSLIIQGSKAARALHAKKINQSDIYFDKDISNEDIQHYLKGFLLANYKFKMINETKVPSEEEKNSLFQPIEKINVHSENGELNMMS